MDFNNIKKDLDRITFCSIRVEENKYFEAVLVLKDQPLLNEILTPYFGQLLVKGKDKIDSRLESIIVEHGGLMAGQALFFKDIDNGQACLAMLWPWQDAEHVTLKLALISLPAHLRVKNK